MKKIFIILVTMLTILLLGGCGFMDIFSQSNESIRDEMLKHLYQKYGVEFTAISLERGHHDFLVAYPTGGDPEVDVVGVQRHVRGGTTEFRDTFFGVIIREDIETRLAEALSDLGMPVQVVFPSSTVFFDNKFDSEKTFSDFNEWVNEENPIRLIVSVFLGFDSEKETDNVVAQVFDKIQDLGYMLIIDLYLTPPTIHGQVTRSNRVDFIAQHLNDLTIISQSVNFGGE
jgi:hypothetical protein